MKWKRRVNKLSYRRRPALKILNSKDPIYEVIYHHFSLFAHISSFDIFEAFPSFWNFSWIIFFFMFHSTALSLKLNKKLDSLKPSLKFRFEFEFLWLNNYYLSNEITHFNEMKIYSSSPVMCYNSFESLNYFEFFLLYFNSSWGILRIWMCTER